MAGNEKSLQDTVKEVIGERIANAKSSEQSTELGASSAKSGDTQSGGTPDYVAGVDISDIPEQDRPRIKEKLEKKLKLLESGYTPKYQKVAKLEKSLEWLASKGLTAEKAEAILLKSLEGEKLTPTEQKRLDKLISESPVEQKEALQNMRVIVKEEAETDNLKRQVAELTKAVQYLSGKDTSIGRQQVEADLTSLETKFGKELISKHRDAIISEWEKYPQTKAKDILKYVAPDEEYEHALLSKGSREKEKLNAVTNNGNGVQGSEATLNIRKSSYKDILGTIIKQGKRE